MPSDGGVAVTVGITDSCHSVPFCSSAYNAVARLVFGLLVARIQGYGRAITPA